MHACCVADVYISKPMQLHARSCLLLPSARRMQEPHRGKRRPVLDADCIPAITSSTSAHPIEVSEPSNTTNPPKDCEDCKPEGLHPCCSTLELVGALQFGNSGVRFERESMFSRASFLMLSAWLFFQHCALLVLIACVPIL